MPLGLPEKTKEIALHKTLLHIAVVLAVSVGFARAETVAVPAPGPIMAPEAVEAMTLSSASAVMIPIVTLALLAATLVSTGTGGAEAPVTAFGG